MKKFSTLIYLVALISLVTLTSCAPYSLVRPQPELYDLVINGGTVIDPASNTTAAVNIGINQGTIVKLSDQALTGIEYIDAAGKTIAPGFIDLHTHSPFPYGEAFQVQDGVTTALELEAGAFPATEYGSFIKGQAHANYGSSVAHYAIRIKVIEGKDQPYMITKDSTMVPGRAFKQQATPEQIEQMRKLLHEGIDKGGIGIGFLLDYMSPAISDAELKMIFDVAKQRDVVVWAHIRRGVNGDIQPLKDIIKVVEEVGNKLHICHINANAMGEIANWLALIDEANAAGADISMELYPYTAGSTFIGADVFNRDWQTIFGISYEDVQWSETGEFMTQESWQDKRKNHPDGIVIHHYMQEEWIKTGLQHPEMMIGSDAMPAIGPNSKVVPNGIGSYTRLLAYYVRELKLLTLQDAIAKASYYPARRLESFAPVFARKGRIQEGADADLLVFDIERLQDHATYTSPYQVSTGWDYIIVGGNVVVDHGKATGLKPGQQILANEK